MANFSGDPVNAIIVHLKNGQREVYDADYYEWEVCDGILSFTDDKQKRTFLYAMSNVHKIEIENW